MDPLQLKGLVRKAILYLVILMGIDQCVGALLDLALNHSPDGRYYKAKYSLEDCQDDIVIIGDSRGEMDYLPTVIEDSLHMSCWNASRGGQGLPYFRIIQEGLLKRYTPKLILFNVEDNMLEMPTEYERAGFLRPFYQDHPEIRPFIDAISPFEKWLIQSRLYAFNSSFYYLFRPYIFHNLDGELVDHGWKPRFGLVNPREEREFTIESELAPLNPEAVDLFEEFMDRFKKAGVQVIIVTPPNYNLKVVNSSTDQYVANYCRKNQIPLFRYSENMSFITHASWYGDRDHFNPEGALLFTRKVAHKIKDAFDLVQDPVTVIEYE